MGLFFFLGGGHPVSHNPFLFPFENNDTCLKNKVCKDKYYMSHSAKHVQKKKIIILLNKREKGKKL